MKITYISPTLNIIHLNTATHLLVLSNGGKGNEGEHAESRSFWGTSIFEEDEEEAEDDFAF